MADDSLRKRMLESVRGYVEPPLPYPGPDWLDNPQGIHVDDARDIPDFLDKIRNAVLDEIEQQIIPLFSREARSTDAYLFFQEEVRRIISEMRDG